MLKVSGVSAYYGESIILKDIGLEVKKGQIVCLLGRNGVGKSTFLKSVMGLVKTPAGSIALDGVESSPTASHVNTIANYDPSIISAAQGSRGGFVRMRAGQS